MRQLLFTILVCCICAITSFAQPKADEPTAHIQKLYFPASLYNDSVAFDKAMPGLSEKLMNGLSEKEKKDFEKIANYYLWMKDYPKAIESIDSLQKKQDDPLNAMELKVYAKAKILQKDKGVEFDQAFKQEFTNVYNSLSFRQKVSEALFDTTAINDIHKSYTDFKEQLKKNKADSLSFEDAQSLVDKYSNYTFYGGVYPLMSPLIAGPQYQQMRPAIKGYKWAGVVPVQNVDEIADKKMKYKLLMELTGFAAKGQEATAKYEINGGLGEVARKVNLHVAAGIPKENIDLVIIVHAGALFALLNNDKYKRKYGVDNPNIALIKELQDFGAKIIVCGQAMTFLRLEKENLVAGVKEAVSAQTVLSTYELKGYKLYDVTLD